MADRNSSDKVIRGLKDWLLYNIEYGDADLQEFWYQVLDQIDKLEDGTLSDKRDLG